jgi:hypothetical protein
MGWMEAAAAALVALYLGLFVWAIRHQHNLFWNGYLDGVTLRFLWRAWRTRS